MYLVGRDLNTIIIGSDLKSRAIFYAISHVINNTNDKSYFNDCGAEHGYLDISKYDGVCLHIYDLRKICGLEYITGYTNYTFSDSDIQRALPFFSSIHSQIYKNLLAYCLLSKKPDVCEIWDLCVLSPYRSTGHLSKSVGGSIGQKFIHDITQYGIAQLCNHFWAIIKPHNKASATVFFRNNFKIIKVSNTDSSGVLTGYPTESIEVKIVNFSSPSEKEVASELAKFTEISDAIEKINKKNRVGIYLPPETVNDIIKITNIEESEVAGRLVFKELSPGRLETVIGPNGSGYFKVYMYNQFIRGTTINPKPNAFVNGIAGSLTFHTHPYSLFPSNNYYVQLPSGGDIMYTIEVYKQIGPGFLTNFIFTVGGFFIINFKLDFANMLNNNMTLEIRNKILTMIHELYISRIVEICGDDDACFFRIAPINPTDEFRKKFMENSAPGKVDGINKLSFKDVILFEKEHHKTNVSEDFFNYYISKILFPFESSKIQIFTCKFIQLNESAIQSGVFFELEDAYPDDLIIANIPPLNKHTLISPLGNCNDSCEDGRYNCYQSVSAHETFTCDHA